MGLGDCLHLNEDQFIGYEEAVRIFADMQNHSPTEESSYATRLSGGYRKNIGLAKSLSFPDPLGFSGQNMPGDKITIGPRVKKQSGGLFQRGASMKGRYGKYIDIAEAKRNPAIMEVLMAITASVPVWPGC